MKYPKRVVVSIVIGLVSCIIAFVVWRTSGKPTALAGERRQDLPVAAREHFAKFKVESLVTLDEESLSKLLTQGKTDSTGKHSESELQEVAKATAEFIHMRFLQDSPAAYREWRKRKGYAQRSEEIIKGSGVAVNWGFWTNRPGQEPSFVDLADLMDGSFAASLDALGGRARPVKIATDAEAFVIDFYREDRGHPTPKLEGTMGSDLWLGNISASPLSLWEPPHSRKTLLSKPGWLRGACVGVILEGATGDRLPWLFTWIQDPENQKWYLSWVNIQNYDGNLPMIVF